MFSKYSIVSISTLLLNNKLTAGQVLGNWNGRFPMVNTNSVIIGSEIKHKKKPKIGFHFKVTEINKISKFIFPWKTDTGDSFHSTSNKRRRHCYITPTDLYGSH